MLAVLGGAMSATSIAPCLASERMDWRTPQNVVDLVREFAGGEIALDPCSGPGSIVGARVEWTEADDGLPRPWTIDAHGGVAYVNPPYGRALPTWTEMCANEAMSGCEIALLVPARPDTRWWHSSVVGAADAICFWRGRLRFLGAPSSAPFPSALVYYGRREERFREVFAPYGWVVAMEKK